MAAARPLHACQPATLPPLNTSTRNVPPRAASLYCLPPSHAPADYMQKPQFLKNFWDGFREVLGPGHKIRALEK